MQAVYLTSAALLLLLCGWAFFRKPGVTLAQAGSLWKAGERLTPPGVICLIAGFVLAVAGVAVKLLG